MENVEIMPDYTHIITLRHITFIYLLFAKNYDCTNYCFFVVLYKHSFIMLQAMLPNRNDIITLYHIIITV